MNSLAEHWKNEAKILARKESPRMQKLLHSFFMLGASSATMIISAAFDPLTDDGDDDAVADERDDEVEHEHEREDEVEEEHEGDPAVALRVLNDALIAVGNLTAEISATSSLSLVLSSLDRKAARR